MDKKIVNIIAGGNSVKDMDVKAICAKAFTIGVNDAAVHAPIDIGISMDRRWAEYRHEQIKGKPFWLHKSKEEWPELWKFKYKTIDDFSELPHELNGKNSGYCALNLAYHMKPKKVFLFGFDFTGKPYWYPAYPWVKYPTVRSRMDSDWLKGFDIAKKYMDKVEIEVIIVGESVLSQFKKISYEEYLKCII